MSIFRVFGLSLILLLGACTSTMDESAQQHAKDVKKWKELASYAGDELKYWDYTVTAEIKVDMDGEQKQFKLADVKLGNKSLTKRIDLLSPEFAEKFVCGEECEFVSLYKGSEGINPTALSQFFEASEGQFFRFYGKMLNVNEKLKLYRETVPNYLKMLLVRVIHTNKSYDSELEFIDELSSLLEEENFRRFIETDTLDGQEKRIVMEDITTDLPTENPHMDGLPWNNGSDVQENRVSQFDLHYADPMESTEDESIMLAFVEREEQELLNSQFRVETLKSARAVVINVGDTVCTFSDNRFGEVESITGDDLMVKLVGTAKMIVDGLKTEAPEGYLYGNLQNVHFVRLHGSDIYNRSDLSACNINY